MATYGDYVSHLRDRVQRAHDIAREHLKQQANQHRECADARKLLTLYATGDLVWYLSETGQMSVAPKLRVPYQGPVLVLRQIFPLNYLIQLDEEGTQRLVRHDRLRPYEGLHMLPWARAALKKARHAKTSPDDQVATS